MHIPIMPNDFLLCISMSKYAHKWHNQIFIKYDIKAFWAIKAFELKTHQGKLTTPNFEVYVQMLNIV